MVRFTGRARFRKSTTCPESPRIRVMSATSCPRMVNGTAERTDYVKQMVEDFDVDGVVFQRIRYCDLWGGQMLQMEKDLRESRIPMLSLDREYSLSATGQLRTRVQAFLERLEGD